MLEIWQAGRKINTAGFTITAATALGIGPITAGKTISGTTTCTLTGTGTSFPSGAPVYVRWSTVGKGAYTAAIFQNGTSVGSVSYQSTNDVGCGAAVVNATAGTWRIDIMINNQVVQSTTFTVG